jgi:colicin import membrane protein
VLKAAERAFADVGLLKDENQGLRAQNNEKKTREHVKERKIGEAKVMGYEAIVEAMQVRDRKEAEAERKKAERERKKAERQRRKVERENNKAERKRGKASKVRKSRVTKRTVASASQSEPQRAVETSSVLPTEPAYQAANVALSNQSTNMTDIV